MGRRADQITASDPDLVKRLSGNGDYGTGGPVAFTGSGKTSNSQLAFSTSLRKVIASKEAAKTKKLEKLEQVRINLNRLGIPKSVGF